MNSRSRQAVLHTLDLPLTNITVKDYEVCFALPSGVSMGAVQTPPLVLHFDGGADMVLPRDNYFQEPRSPVGACPSSATFSSRISTCSLMSTTASSYLHPRIGRRLVGFGKDRRADSSVLWVLACYPRLVLMGRSLRVCVCVLVLEYFFSFAVFVSFVWINLCLFCGLANRLSGLF